MQIIKIYKKKKKNRIAIWKPWGEWFCFVGNVLVGVKNVSSYKKIVYISI